MGWQDAPVVEGRAAWESAPIVGGNQPVQSVPQPSSNTEVAVNAANKGISALPDSILNAPNTIMNLGKAAFGTVAGLAGRPDLMPELTPNPDFARRGMESAGFINPAVQPQGPLQKGIDFATQGAVGGALTGGAGLAKTAVGAATGAVSGLASGGTMEATGNPALAAVAGMLPAAGAIKSTDRAAQSRNAVGDRTLNMAREAGYVVPPSATGGSWIGNRIEGIGGKTAIGQEAAVRNQQVTNSIARQEAGLKPNDPISPVTLKEVRDVLAQPYREVAAISPLAKNAFEKMQEARVEAKAQWDYYRTSKHPDALKEAKKLDARADMYESAIERIASRNGNPELMQRVREARVALAKNYAVDNAVNVGSGDVDAHVIGRMLDKRKPLSNGLETIGRFANSFDSYSREGVKGPGVSKLEGYGAAGLATLGHMAAPGAGGVLAGAVPLVAPPLARSLMLSRMMQGQKQYGPGTISDVASQTSPIVTNNTLADLLRQQ